MKSVALRSLLLIALAFSCCLFAVSPLYATDNFLTYPAPTCMPDPNSLLLMTTVTNSNGVGVTFRSFLVGTIVLRCAVTVDQTNSFTLLEVVAQDNTPKGGAVTATLYEQSFVIGGGGSGSFGPPVALLSVSTVSEPGVIQAAVGNFLNGVLDPCTFMYWIEVRLTRTTTSANAIVYAVGLENAL